MSKQVWKGGNMLYPLPAVMVSCARAGERPNIVTVAWAGTVCTNPAMVSISLRPSRYSYEIIKESGCFVVNLTTKELTRAMDYCGARSGRDVDKFEAMHLTPERAAKVEAPLIKESPVNIECRVQQIMALGSHHMILATVEAVDVDERYLDERGKFNLNRASLVTYSHGTYFALGEQVGTFGYSVRKDTSAVAGKARKKRAGMSNPAPVLADTAEDQIRKTVSGKSELRKAGSVRKEADVKKTGGFRKEAGAKKPDGFRKEFAQKNKPVSVRKPADR